MVGIKMYIVKYIIDKDIQVTNFKLTLMWNVIKPQLRDTNYKSNGSTIPSLVQAELKTMLNFFF